MEVLVHYLGQDVKAAGGGVDVEQDGLGQAHDEHEAEEVEPDVSHHRGLAGLEELLVRKHLAPELDEGTQDQRRVNCLCAEFLADEYPRQHQQHGVDGEYHHGHPELDAELVGQVGDNDRQTGNGAEHKFAGHHEVVHGRRRYEHTDGHDD